MINRQFDCRFVRASDQELSLAKETSFHIAYQENLPNIMVDYRIIANKGTSASILPRNLKADFVFCIRYEDIDPDFTLLDHLKELPEIQFVYHISREQTGEDIYQTLLE